MQNKFIFSLSVVAFLLALCVVVLGAYTRLADAGLGCPDWPTCYGHLWVPNEAHEIQTANESFSDTPVETDKTWPEQLHRIFASSLGLLILIIFIVCNAAYAKQHGQRKLNSVSVLLVLLVMTTIGRMVFGHVIEPILGVIVVAYFVNLLRLFKQLPAASSTVPFKLVSLISGLVILQGLFGMWTVTLKLWPQVVTAHLIGGFATLSLLFLLSLRLFSIKIVAEIAPLKKFAMVGLILVSIQILLGGWTTSNYAALACTDFPTCHGELIPKMDIVHGLNIFQDVGPNYLGGNLSGEGRTAIHFFHRVGALLVTLFLSFLIVRLFIIKARVLALVLAFTLISQISLGIMNVVLYLPLANAVLHNFVGAVLLLVMVFTNYMCRSSSQNQLKQS